MAAIANAFDPRFIVLSVRSPIELSLGSYAWFHVRFTPQGRVINTDEAEVGWRRMPGFVDEVVAAYSADPHRVYVAGFSQGGIIALASLVTAPEKFAGVVCMSGRLLPEALPHAAPIECLRGKRVLVVHGTQDERLTIDHGRWADEQLRGLSLAVDYKEFDMPHVMSDESVAYSSQWLSALLDQYSINGRTSGVG